MRKNPYYNQSGCADPTAYKALKPIVKNDEKMDRTVRSIVNTCKTVAELAGFEIVGRIEIRHKKTGKVWK